MVIGQRAEVGKKLVETTGNVVCEREEGRNGVDWLSRKLCWTGERGSQFILNSEGVAEHNIWTNYKKQKLGANWCLNQLVYRLYESGY